MGGIVRPGVLQGLAVQGYRMGANNDPRLYCKVKCMYKQLVQKA